jgi:SAM-dependent methyltransferase
VVSAGSNGATPWQLRIFEKSLKKQQKVRLLLELLGPLSGSRCLLLTNGDNNGAMNYHFRAAGGDWQWADMAPESAEAIQELLGDPVALIEGAQLPYPDGAFDRVVVIDVHEHLQCVESINREICRVLTPGGLALITTPNGNPRLPVAKLKRWIGMGPAEYGHVVQGYESPELEAMLRREGLVPERRGAYARFFTELAELMINFAYVKVLARRKDPAAAPSGEIAPTSEEKLRRVQKSFRIYSILYPAMRLFSALDRLLPGDEGYAVAITARKAG